MKSYTLDKYDFKDYLLAELPDARQDQFVFWKNKSPLPIDIIYELFENRGALIKKYLDHIGAAYLMGFIKKQNNGQWKSLLLQHPSKNNKGIRSDIESLFEKALPNNGLSRVLNECSEMLLLSNYKISALDFADALCHEGKKYDRIFLPSRFRFLISEEFPELLEALATNNSDMFSNVVCDYLGIYRSGFGDVLSAVFNKLLEFILANSANNQKSTTSVTGFKMGGYDYEPAMGTPFISSNVNDGSIWEPLYTKSGSSFILNKNHPFDSYFRKGKNPNELIIQLLRSMAKIEDQTFRTADKKILERFRQDVSREIRLWLEENPE